MVNLSVVVITFNEERNLARCLDSVKKIADEIIIVDSSSTDKTIAIAQSYSAKITQHPFTGYAAQKNFATQLAANDWILSLDADETLTPELEKSIQQFKNGPVHDVYEMSRLTNYCGKWIRHCGWYPDRQTRLYNRTKGAWVAQKVHEYWKLSGSENKGLLSGDLLHYSFATIGEHLRKIEKYSELAAVDAVEKGKTASLLKVMLSPKWHFISEYFFRLGFMDGFYGYIICKLSAHASFIKYSRIRLYSRNIIK